MYRSTSFFTALFTAASATCVTGLIVADTFCHWTLFGQIVLLCLIQIGGPGFITLGITISILLRKRIGLKERGLLQGVYYEIFHSVSAFCNAGFDLMGRYRRFRLLLYTMIILWWLLRLWP